VHTGSGDLVNRNARRAGIEHIQRPLTRRRLQISSNGNNLWRSIIETNRVS
jgi:hypothetical protein